MRPTLPLRPAHRLQCWDKASARGDKGVPSPLNLQTNGQKSTNSKQEISTSVTLLPAGRETN